MAIQTGRRKAEGINRMLAAPSLNQDSLYSRLQLYVRWWRDAGSARCTPAAAVAQYSPKVRLITNLAGTFTNISTNI